MFNREEIIESRWQYDEEDIGPSQSDRLHCEPSTSYNDSYRTRGYYSEKEKSRNVSNSRRSPRDYEYKSRDERPRDDLRYQSSAVRSRSYDRARDYHSDTKDRFDDRDLHRGSRRSSERDRGRSDERQMRRHPSPDDSRRHSHSYRDYEERRARSLERRDDEDSRVRDYSSGDRFSNAELPSKSRTYYEVDVRENSSPSSRGRGSSFYSRGRGNVVPGRPFIRNTAIVIRQIPPIRAIRGAPGPRIPITGRLPFPPRKSFRGSLQGRR